MQSTSNRSFPQARFNSQLRWSSDKSSSNFSGCVHERVNITRARFLSENSRSNCCSISAMFVKRYWKHPLWKHGGWLYTYLYIVRSGLTRWRSKWIIETCWWRCRRRGGWWSARNRRWHLRSRLRPWRCSPRISTTCLSAWKQPSTTITPACQLSSARGFNSPRIRYVTNRLGAFIFLVLSIECGLPRYMMYIEMFVLFQIFIVYLAVIL